MIRMKCPKCEKKLAVDDSKAGGVAACPECGQRFRIPGTRQQTPASAKSSPAAVPPVAKRRVPEPKVASSKPVKQPAARPTEDWEHEDSSPYQVEKPVESKPPPELRQSMFTEVEEDMEMEDFGMDREYVERKKARRRQERQAELFSGVSYFKAMMYGCLFLFLLFGALAFFKPVFVIIPILVGNAVAFAAGIWFLVLAFMDDDGILPGILCLFVPFYSLYYLITRWDREWRPFVVQLMGLLIIFGSIGLAVGGSAAGFGGSFFFSPTNQQQDQPPQPAPRFRDR